MILPGLQAPKSFVSSDIPRTVHQIWVGSEPPPWVRRCWQTWDEFMVEHHPDWTVVRWTNSIVEKSPLSICGKIAEHFGLGPRGLADLIRLAAVFRYGGLYFDTDTIPLRPLSEFVGSRRPWIGTDEREEGTRALINASFGFPPAHPFLSEVWVLAGEALQRGVTNEHWVAGPRTWRKAMNTGRFSDVEIDYRFRTEPRNPSMQRTIGTAAAFDLDKLRESYPNELTLHIIFTAARYV